MEKHVVLLTLEIAKSLPRGNRNNPVAGIYLNEYSAMDEGVAKELSKIYCSTLSLNGLSDLTVAEATFLSRKPRGKYLILNGLEEVSEAVCKELSKVDGGLELNGIKYLPKSVAEQFRQKGNYLSLDGLETILDRAAAELGSV